MKCQILHTSPGRVRVHVLQNRMALEQADILEYYLRSIPGITSAKVYDRTCNAVIQYTADRQTVLDALGAFSYEKYADLVPEQTGRALNRKCEERLIMTVLSRTAMKALLPNPLHTAVTWFKAAFHIKKGIGSLLQGKIDVALLDATSITVSLLRNDHDTASSIMFLLKVGEILEDWTHKKSVDDLARAMSLNIDQVWLKVDGQEVSVPVDRVSVGDHVVVRTGSMIPLDGTVEEGEAMVNQASMTGESLPVAKRPGSYVYAGTVVEEGECIMCVDKCSGSGRYDRIVHMIEESEKLKSSTEVQANYLADKLVPYSLGATALTWLLTRNVTKALSILMVDFSCALKLAIPLAVLSAMREGRGHHIAAKGGRFLEAVAEADTIVFDKTGTLTHACPKVTDVVAFAGRDPQEMLRLAACLEEHYPHPIANAVVAEAKTQGLEHEEQHSQVEYIVAHGISCRIGGDKVVIGSYHFVFQDEGCVIPESEQEHFASLPSHCSHLFMAISGELAAVLCIEDPLREEAADVVKLLHEVGFKRVVMMTGDSKNAARAAAQAVGVDEYYAEVLPEDKAAFIRREHEAGRKVIMMGDGVNDSPALSQADAGIAIGSGTAIAKEVSDITLMHDDLYALVTLRRLAVLLMERLQWNYRFIMSFNAGLIALGVAGVLPPATSALLHNTSTLMVSLHSMTDLLGADPLAAPNS